MDRNETIADIKEKRRKRNRVCGIGDQHGAHGGCGLGVVERLDGHAGNGGVFGLAADLAGLREEE